MLVVTTTAQLHSTMPELRFYAGSNSACDVLQIRDGRESLIMSRLEIRLNTSSINRIRKTIYIILLVHIFFNSAESATGRVLYNFFF